LDLLEIEVSMYRGQLIFLLSSALMATFVFGGCTHVSSGSIETVTNLVSTQVAETVMVPEVSSASPGVTLTSSSAVSLALHPLEGEIFFLVGSSLYRIDLPSGDLKQLFVAAEYIQGPVPVGTGYIYFMQAGIAKPSQLYRTMLDGSGLERVAYDAFDDHMLAVSPDGSRIAYVQSPSSGGDNEYLYLIDYRRGGLAGAIFTSLGPSIMSLSWSNSGEKLAFFLSNGSRINDREIYGDLYLMDADGTNRTQILSEMPIVYDPLAWSPDDSKIAISLHDNTGNNLYVIDLESQAVSKLTDSDEGVRYPIWSPVGDKILFTQGSKYCIVSTDGTGLKVVAGQAIDPKFFGRGAAWSPDGQHLVYVSQNGDVYLVDPAVGKPSRIASFDHYHIASDLYWLDIPHP
jgi:Tol biopolymer transport system component